MTSPPALPEGDAPRSSSRAQRNRLHREIEVARAGLQAARKELRAARSEARKPGAGPQAVARWVEATEEVTYCEAELERARDAYRLASLNVFYEPSHPERVAFLLLRSGLFNFRLGNYLVARCSRATFHLLQARARVLADLTRKGNPL